MRDHRHHWTVVDFVLEAERPLVRQACACGSERRIKAWERYWTPVSGDTEKRGAPRSRSRVET